MADPDVAGRGDGAGRYIRGEVVGLPPNATAGEVTFECVDCGNDLGARQELALPFEGCAHWRVRPVVLVRYKPPGA